jgi:hypothetical protein
LTRYHGNSGRAKKIPFLIAIAGVAFLLGVFLRTPDIPMFGATQDTPTVTDDESVPHTDPMKFATLELKKAGEHSVTYWVVLDGAKVGEINIHSHRSKTGQSVGHTVIWY